MSAIAAVRVKGHRRIRTTIEDSMKSLRLTRANHCVIVPATPDYQGQLQHAKDYITYGPIEAPEIAALIRARGRLEGDKPVTDEVIAKGTKYKSIIEFAQAIARGEAKYGDLAGVTPIFRLTPPKKGYKGGIKRGYGAHGNLGNRGPAIAELIQRMI
jgi:large subunit ribosomal protein L30